MIQLKVFFHRVQSKLNVLLTKKGDDRQRSNFLEKKEQNI